MQLERYISDLLLKHNCVIVPNFGGFVGNNVPAKIDKLKNRFQPPSKEIGFNQNLTKNDGLLINEVANRLSVSYENAESEVNTAVTILKNKLNSNKSLPLKNIGLLFLDKSNKLHFEPSFDFNYSLNAYGLSTFHVLPIVKEQSIIIEAAQTARPLPETKQVKEGAREAKIVSIEKKEIKLPTKNWRKIAFAAALFPLVMYVGWLSYATELFRGNNFSYADMNPFTTKICPVYKVRSQTKAVKIEEVNSFFSLNGKGNTVSFSLFDKLEPQFNAEKMITAYLVEKSTEIPVNTSTRKPEIKKGIYRFHIIAGCFGVYRNAEKLAAKLRKKGFNSAIIDRKKGLYRVAFQSYISEKDAEKALKYIKNKQNKNAWLLEK